MPFLFPWPFSRQLPTTTVIIPTYNEQHNIQETINHVFRSASSKIQIIVADGYSTDDTTRIAKRAGARVLYIAGGRATQLNKAATFAHANHLLFLHADTKLPYSFDKHVNQILKDPSVSIGAFRLKIDAPGLPLRIIERVANWRSVVLKRPYGDQALFCTSNTFKKIGNFPNMPFLEDYEIVRRATKHGHIVISNQYVKTSARRWQTLGAAKTTVLNQFIIVAYHVGVPVERLRLWYRGALQHAIQRQQLNT